MQKKYNRNLIVIHYEIVMCYYPDLGNASDWSCHEGNFLQPIIHFILLCFKVEVQ